VAGDVCYPRGKAVSAHSNRNRVAFRISEVDVNHLAAGMQVFAECAHFKQRTIDGRQVLPAILRANLYGAFNAEADSDFEVC